MSVCVCVWHSLSKWRCIRCIRLCLVLESRRGLFKLANEAWLLCSPFLVAANPLQKACSPTTIGPCVPWRVAHPIVIGFYQRHCITETPWILAITYVLGISSQRQQQSITSSQYHATMHLLDAASSADDSDCRAINPIFGISSPSIEIEGIPKSSGIHNLSRQGWNEDSVSFPSVLI